MDRQLARYGNTGRPPILMEDCDVYFEEDEDTRDRLVAMRNCTVHFGEKNKEKRRRSVKNTEQPTNQVQCNGSCRRQASQAIEAPHAPESNPFTAVINRTITGAAIGTCACPGVGSAVGAATAFILGTGEAIYNGAAGNS